MFRENKNSDSTIRILIVMGELVMMNLGLVAMFYTYTMGSDHTPPHYKRLMLLMTMVYVLCEMLFPSRLQHRFVRVDQLFKNLVFSMSSFLVVSLFVMWVFRWPLMTWRFMLPFYTFVIVFVGLYRWAVRQFVKWYRRMGRNSTSVLFIGNVNIAEKLYKRMEEYRSSGFIVLGYFDDVKRDSVSEEGYLGTLNKVLEYLGSHKVHEVYCMLPSSQNPMINQIIAACDKRMIRYNHIPDSFNYQHHKMAFSLMMGTPVMTIHEEPLSLFGNRLIKRLFDILVSGTFLLLVFPWVYLIFGFLIKKSSPGPIFFKQKRSGIDGKDFYCYKFRSMKVNVDSDKVQATKDDPRKTRIGEFMRRTSVDELPQFINVLKGDMSVVGPRPHMLKHTEEYSGVISNYMVRHYAKPGITGWAQVKGFRGETKELWQMEGRVRLDIWYIENWSLPLDLYIMYKTVANALQGDQQAY